MKILDLLELRLSIKELNDKALSSPCIRVKLQTDKHISVKEDVICNAKEICIHLDLWE